MDEDVIRAAYESYNARDIEAVVALMCDDVKWTNPMTGDLLKGKDEIRAIWKLQWSSVQPSGEVKSIYVDAEGRTIVRARMQMRQNNGLLLLDDVMEMIYTLRDGLIARMEIRELQPETAPTA